MITEIKQRWLSILIIILFAIVVFGIGFLLSHIPPEVPPSVKCKNECSNFSMDYYKIDLVSNAIICWCLDTDGKPRSIGSVK